MSTPPVSSGYPQSFAAAPGSGGSSGSGLNQSTPLVTVPPSPPVGLRRPPPPPPPAGSNQPPGTQNVGNPPNKNTGNISAYKSPLLSPPVGAATSLDDFATMFLASPSPRTEEFGLDPIVTPEPLPSPEQKINDLERLQILIERRAWDGVVLVAEQLLHGQNSHLSPLYKALIQNVSSNNDSALILDSHKSELAWVMTIHIQALAKLKYYEKLKSHLMSWSFCHFRQGEEKHDKPHPKAPEWIPWIIHILAANCLVYTYLPSKAIDALWNIRSSILIDAKKSTTSQFECAIALLQVENTLANVFIEDKQWRMALESLERMMTQNTEIDFSPMSVVCAEYIKRQETPNVSATVLQFACCSEILSRQGRILLQAGALEEAEEIFRRASDVWDSLNFTCEDLADPLCFVIRTVPCQLQADQGLLHFSNAKYNEATDYFNKTVEYIRLLRKHMITTSPRPFSSQDWINNSCLTSTTPILLLGDERAYRQKVNALYSETVNNLSLCALYTCHLANALNIVESLVREDPAAFLTDRVALNLCTLYELGSDSTISSGKKKVLEVIAKRFHLHDISTECFRI